MSHIKLIQSLVLCLLFFSINHLVDAELKWEYQYTPSTSLLIATAVGQADCAGRERRSEAGEVMDLTVKCKGSRVFKHTWKNETKFSVMDPNVDRHDFRITCNDEVFPVGVKCELILVAVNCESSDFYTRME